MSCHENLTSNQSNKDLFKERKKKERMNCVNEQCSNEATLQFDHNGKLVFYCEGCWGKWNRIMEAMGSFVPTAYPIGTASK